MLNLSLSVILVANPLDLEQEVVEMQGIEAAVGQGGTLVTAVVLDEVEVLEGIDAHVGMRGAVNPPVGRVDVHVEQTTDIIDIRILGFARVGVLTLVVGEGLPDGAEDIAEILVDGIGIGVLQVVALLIEEHTP